MRRLSQRSLPTLLGIAWCLAVCASALATAEAPVEPAHIGVFSCTSLMAASDGLVLLGDCEDAGAGHPLAGNPAGSYVFFLPGHPLHGELGRMHLGWLWQGQYRSFQAGMNEAGLAYSLTAVPEKPMNSHPERPYVHGRDSFYDTILRNAATVDEAIAWTLRFDFSTVWFQILYADAAGHAAILSPGPDGEMAITRRPEGSSVLVAATFNASDPERFIGRDSFVRFEDGQEALTDLVSAGRLSVPAVSEVVEQVTRARPYAFNGSYTMYATTYDLTHRVAHVYVLGNHTEPIVIDLVAELERGEHRTSIAELVPAEQLERDVRRYWAVQVAGLGAVILGVGAIVWGAVRLLW
ncbi:hypothetical protein JW848_03000 [Candidatus Bipolaricaulota bacterium]|nr:hypothetical protein [Candidatus Bipolaricaulota bacterium]